MGPRLFSRGNNQSGIFYRIFGYRFNGATTFQPWKSMSREGSGPNVFSSFNGATTFQPWKWHPCQLFSRPPRSFNGATTFQPWKCDRCHMAKVAPRCFNGATTFQPWKSSRALHSPGSSCASMGPRLFSRGNQASRHLLRSLPSASMGPRLFSRGNISILNHQNQSSPLQWGHDFSAVEMMVLLPLSGRTCCFNGATTFQPWK